MAGLRADGTGWIRPVSDEEHGVLRRHHFVLGDGKAPNLLDIIEIEVAQAPPEPHQPENWLLVDRPWEKIGMVRLSDALSFLLRPVSGSRSLAL